MLIVRPYVHLRQPEDGQYRPKHVVVHYIVIKYTSSDIVVFDCLPFPKIHTHTTGITLPRGGKAFVLYDAMALRNVL